MKHVSVGILARDGYVLACQRKRTADYPLKWEFPGGKLEPGETLQEALYRELREELAIKAGPMTEFHRQEWIYGEGMMNPERDGAFRVTYFLVPTFTGEPENHAFEEIRWVTPTDLQKMDILEGNREAIGLLLGAGK